MKKIAILGSTGSIGTSLINILKKDKKKFKIELITAKKNYKRLIKQTKYFNVKNIIITDKKSFLIARELLKNKKINIYNNFNSLKYIFRNKKVDYTMGAISGFEGLKPTLDMIKFSKVIAIANKESIICGWQLIKKELDKFKTRFIPIDSEHFSIFSLIESSTKDNIEQVFITASGGPFKNLPYNRFKSIKVNDALNHPNWTMGKKISIDSATMMNKVFEIIEAKKIFNLNYNQLNIYVHSQSYIHAIVKFTNGLTKILIHDTNMTIPIFNSLYPKFEKKIKTNRLNKFILNNLELNEVDIKKFPAVKLINILPDKDSLFETVLVSANDALVDLFLKKKINFTDITSKLIKISKLREFKKYKSIKPRNIAQIEQLAQYVSLKTYSLSI
ncbi:1-deoxy-D-xylulose-5-phosphate reductoisomerase [Candidatus Pelagibacter sp.]|jgi:1-deoxy-D-xylulose-5-phosphate reductoisomerase|nr:1-deoxy-D-xylulose-5-phosphate reductoisomerase [Candidatus Pelagibacter sp.]